MYYVASYRYGAIILQKNSYELWHDEWIVLKISNLSRSSRFARLQGVQCAMAGRNLYMRFSCCTGDAMGMNMVSKGVQNVLDYLQDDFPDMDVISISGKQLCSSASFAQIIHTRFCWSSGYNFVLNLILVRKKNAIIVEREPWQECSNNNKTEQPFGNIQVRSTLKMTSKCWNMRMFSATKPFKTRRLVSQLGMM